MFLFRVGSVATSLEHVFFFHLVLPVGVGLGATFDREVWSSVGHIIGQEARGLNNQGDPGGNGKSPNYGVSGLYFLDPNINLCRDPRWGRCQASS